MEKRREILTLALIVVLVTKCYSYLLDELPLTNTLLEAENITEKLQRTIDNILTFDMYKEMFKKTYKDVDTEQKALQNFLFNDEDIKRHNVEYTAGNVPFVRALWEYSDMSADEVNEDINGFIRPVTTRSSQETVVGITPPKSLNYVKKGFVTKGIQQVEKTSFHFNFFAVQKQGRCGSCWSFSAIGAVEGQIFKKTEKLNSFSKQNLIDCNFNKDVGNFGCDGGDMIHAFNYLIEQKGLAFEKLYSYQESDKFQCRFNDSQTGEAVKSYVSLSPCSEKNLELSLVKYGPIAIAVDASLATFQSYKTGVYFDPKCSSNINHAVLLVGYGTDKKTNEKFWLIKNSYGESWGENG